MICEQCGQDHTIDGMELSFRRPDEIAVLSEEERKHRVQENSDLCMLDGQRFFIRGVLPLPLPSDSSVYHIGLWVEVERAAFERVYELWDEEGQAEEPGFSALIANEIPLLPATMGLRCTLHLTGTDTRPNVLVAVSEHPLYAEQVGGISAHRAHEYSSLFA